MKFGPLEVAQGSFGSNRMSQFFVKPCCLWHKYVEKEIIFGGINVLHFPEKGPKTAIFDLVKYGSEWENGDLFAFRQQFWELLLPQIW